MKICCKKIALVSLLYCATTAMAHVTLEQAEAFSGAYYKAVLRVGHGCAGSATRALTVRLPAGAVGAKPMPKPGWTLGIQLQKTPSPNDSTGQQAARQVAEITWQANSPPDYLADAHYGEFVLLVRLPEKAGPIWFKVVQTCEIGQIDWAEVPESGSLTQGLKTPAARLEVRPAAVPRLHH